MPVVDALHDAILEAGLEAPVLVGHSIGGPIACRLNASGHRRPAVVSIDAPIRFEPFADQLRALGPKLAGPGFERDVGSLPAELGTDFAPHRSPAGCLHLRERPSLGSSSSAYQSDLLERPLDEVVRWRDEGLSQLGRVGTPYLALQTARVDREEGAFLAARVPQAEVVVWPVGHHFPHLADPARFAALLAGLAAAAPDPAPRPGE